MRSMYRFITGIMIMAAVVGCEASKKKEVALEAVPVKVSQVTLQAFREVLDYVGDIKAKDEVVVYPKVTGKISEKVKEDGSAVGKGDPIAYIDRDEIGLKFEKAPVESPLTGLVGRVYVDIGENVSTQTPVALVVNVEQVKINLEIPEKHVVRVKPGQTAKLTVDAYPGQEFSGVVTKASPVLDLGTRTAPIEITVENPDHALRSGMFAKVGLIIAEHLNTPVVLKEAVMGKAPNEYVYTVSGNQATLQKVVIGIRQGAYCEVREGLKAGDRVVVMGQQELNDGSAVIIEE